MSVSIFILGIYRVGKSLSSLLEQSMYASLLILIMLYFLGLCLLYRIVKVYKSKYVDEHHHAYQTDIGK